MAIQEWNEGTEKYIDTMIDTSLNENVEISVVPLNNTLRDYYLHTKSFSYQVTIRNDVDKALELIRSRNAAITWCISSCIRLKNLPIANGDMLKVYFETNTFNEQFEELLTFVIKVRIAKIFNVARVRLKDEQYELLQILADKGGTVIEHNISD